MSTIQKEITSTTSTIFIDKLSYDLQSLAVRQTPTADHLIIFLHGYNNGSIDIENRRKLIHNKLGSKYVITTAFNWKSLNAFYGYKSDQQCAEKCAKHFIYFLQRIVNRTQFKKIDIVAHSMGNFLLTKSIDYCVENNSLHLFKGIHIIALAADVCFIEYWVAIEAVQHYVSSWTHYYNLLDTALVLSNHIAQKRNYIPIIGTFYKCGGRAGQSASDHEFVKSINWCTAMNGHGYIDNVFAKHSKLAPHIIERRKKEDAYRAMKDKIWEIFFVFVVVLLFIFAFEMSMDQMIDKCYQVVFCVKYQWIKYTGSKIFFKIFDFFV